MGDVGQDLWLATSTMTPGDTRYGIAARKTIIKIKKLEGFVFEPDPRIAIAAGSVGGQTSGVGGTLQATVSAHNFSQGELKSNSLIVVGRQDREEAYHCEYVRATFRRGRVTEHVLRLRRAQEQDIIST
jgi:hypothetical protein